MNMKKTRGIFFAFMLLAVLAACTEYDEGFSRIQETSRLTFKANMPSQSSTRVLLAEEKGTKNLTAKWEEEDSIQLFFRQDNINHPGGYVKVSEITADSKGAFFSTDLPAAMLYNKPFTIYGFYGIKGNVDDEGIAYTTAEVIRDVIDSIKAPMFFQKEVGIEQETVIGTHAHDVNLRHFGTYEVLHLRNFTDAGISFEHWGFLTETPWYQGIAKVRFVDGKPSSAPTGEWDSDTHSEPCDIRAGITTTFVSWYMPSGFPMTEAKLATVINGEPVYSSNTKSSDVTFETAHAYHMYATWDGKELMFDNGDMKSYKLVFSTYKESGEQILFKLDGNDVENIWVDINGNGRKDDTEQLNYSSEEQLYYYDGTVDSQTITIYGDITKFVSIRQLISEINVSECPHLRTLGLYANAIESLDLSSNKELVNIDCNECGVKKLILPETSTLRLLDCQSNNAIESIDISKNPSLESLLCQNTSIKNIDTSNNPKLKMFLSDGSKLERLDLSNNQELECLGISRNKFDAEALDNIFQQLPDVSGKTESNTAVPWPKMVRMLRLNNNPGESSCNKSFAEDKGWEFDDKWAIYYDSIWKDDEMNIFY